MALEEGSGTGLVMPVGPMYGNGGGFGNDFGGSGWWIILLFLLLGMGGWNNGTGGGYGGGGLFPWMNQSNQINEGFRDQMINDNVTGIRNTLGDISTQLCSGFAGTAAAVTGAQNAIAQQLYTNQISDLERSFAAQTASTAGMSGIQAQLAQCCCDNRLATESLRATVLAENCADRATVSDGIRDVMENCNRNNQAILDKLCSLELNEYKRENDNLRQQLNMATLAASQTAQTAAIKAGQVAEIDAMYQRLKDCPIPCQPVYGNTEIFRCNGTNGCGCGGF